MAKAVVDALEVIDVDQRHRERLAAALRGGEQARHRGVEIAAVEQPGVSGSSIASAASFDRSISISRTLRWSRRSAVRAAR